MSWLTTAIRVGMLLVVAALVGWYYGRPVWAMCGALLALVGYWLYQMYQVQRWLENSVETPPETYGIWGDLLSQIYQLQKKGKQANDRLQSTVNYLQDSFASMRDGVAVVDDNGVLKWFNNQAQILLELRPADAGQILTNLVRSPEILAYFNRGDFSAPLEYRTAGEAGTWLSLEVTRFGDGDRLLFVRDITSSVRMEQVRKDFVANVSHELRTPLTVISGYLATFLGDTDKLPPGYIKPLQQMLQQADRMETLLKDLLWLSRIEGEQGLATHTPVDIGAMMTELQDELRTAYPGREIRLELTAQYKVPGDYRELYSAASNLLVNAIKYSEDSSEVTVTWKQQDGSYYLSVRDQGTGIDAIHIPRLTERFYRVEDSRCATNGGTGLGLAIVKHVAASHGARLQITSNPGKGSTFSLIFPGQGEIAAAQPVSASLA